MSGAKSGEVGDRKSNLTDLVLRQDYGGEEGTIKTPAELPF